MNESKTNGLLFLSCGRCGDSMSWRVNLDGRGTELLIVPCSRCLSQSAADERERLKQEQLERYSEDVHWQSEMGNLLRSEHPPLELLDRTCYGASDGPFGEVRVGTVKKCWGWFREKAGAA